MWLCATYGLTRRRRRPWDGFGACRRLVATARLGLLLAAPLLAFPLASAADMPPVPPAATAYYVAEQGDARGPLARSIIIAEIRDGIVHPWTLVWKPGLSGWIRAGSLPEFFEALAEARPAPPSPPPLPPETPGSGVEPAWFVAIDGAARGPWSGEALAAAIEAGEVGPATLVWRSGSAGWLAAASDPELAHLFPISPPELPPELPPEPGPMEPSPPEPAPPEPVEPVPPEPVGPALPEVGAPELPPPADVSSAMVGTWTFGPADGEGFGVRTRITFAEDMTFTGEVSMAIAGGATEPQSIAGTWQATAAGEGRLTLVLTVGSAGPSETAFRIVDGDTLVNEADGSTARRIGN